MAKKITDLERAQIELNTAQNFGDRAEILLEQGRRTAKAIDLLSLDENGNCAFCQHPDGIHHDDGCPFKALVDFVIAVNRLIGPERPDQKGGQDG